MSGDTGILSSEAGYIEANNYFLSPANTRVPDELHHMYLKGTLSYILYKISTIGLAVDMVTLYPGSSTRNVVQATGDYTTLTLKAAAGQTANLLDIKSSTDAVLASIDPTGIIGSSAYFAVTGESTSIPTANGSYFYQTAGHAVIRQIGGNSVSLIHNSTLCLRADSTGTTFYSANTSSTDFNSFRFLPGNSTARTNVTELFNIQFTNRAVHTWNATGTLIQQREWIFDQPSYGNVHIAGMTIAEAVAVAIQGAPSVGANMTIGKSIALRVLTGGGVGLVVRGTDNQTPHMQEWDAGGNIRTYIDGTAKIVTAGLTLSSGGTMDVSAGTLTLADNQIGWAKVSKSGAVASDVGADAAGTASGLMSAHTGASDPHTQYQKESEKGAASGYASLDSNSLVPLAQLPYTAGNAISITAGVIDVVPDDITTEIVADTNVKLLLHMDGTTDSTTFTDSSSYSRAVVAYNGAKIANIGGGVGFSGYASFGENGDYLSITDLTGMDFSHDTLIDFRVKTAAFLLHNTYFLTAVGPGPGTDLVIGLFGYLPGDKGIEVSVGGVQYKFYDDGLFDLVDEWVHIAIIKKNDQWRYFRNGVQKGDTLDITWTLGSFTEIKILSDELFYAYSLDEYRILMDTDNGWWGGFTPPTAPYSSPQRKIGVKSGVYALVAHAHGNITSAGKIGSTANLPLITTTDGIVTVGAFGTGATNFCAGDDARLFNARTPTAHASSHTTGSDLISAFVGDSGSGGVIGFVPAPAAGDAAANKFLKANGTWATAGGGGTWGSITGTLSDQSDLSLALGGKNVLTGFVNRTGSTLGMSGSTFQVTTGSSYDFYSNGTKYTKNSTQSVSISTDLALHYIYFDSSGVLQVSTSAWDIESDNVPVAIVYKDGSNYIIGEERHGYRRNRNWHKWAHLTIGTRYETGFSGTFTNTTLSVTRGTVWDEDIANDSGATKTTANLYYRNSGLTAMRVELASSTPYKASSGVIQYDNAGTLTNASTSNYVNYWMYATNDITNPIAVVVGQSQSSSLATIRAETLPSILFGTAEWKLIYRIIYRNVGGTATYVEASDYRSSSSLPIGSSPTVNAASVTYVPTSPLTATNMQGAMDQVAGYLGGVGLLTFNLPAANSTAGTQSEFDSATVGESVAFPDLLYMKSDGKWWKADADQATTMPGLRMALETKSADATCSMLVKGYVRDDTWNWTVGGTAGMIFASTTTGGLVQTPPSGTGDQIQAIATAVTSAIIFFNPSSLVVEAT